MKVLLSLHALKLRNVAGFGKGISDPYAVVTLIANEPGTKPVVLGKTEVIKNNLSPHWVKKFEIDYEFGKPTRINVGVYDEIRKAKNNKPMGSAVFEIGETLGKRGSLSAKKLKGGGTLFVRVEKGIVEDTGTFHLQLRGVKMKNVDGVFGKSDPFFEVSKLIKAAGGPSWQVIHRSKPVQNDLNPKWEQVSFKMNDLADGKSDHTIRISVFDWDKKGKNTSMGFFETTVDGLISAKVHSGTGDPKTIDTSKGFRLTKKGKFFGFVVVTQARLEGYQDPTTTTLASTSPSSTTSVAATTAPVHTNETEAINNGIPFSQALDHPPPEVRPITAAAAGVAAGAMAYSAPPPSRNPSLPPPVAPPSSPRPSFVDYVTGGLQISMSIAIDFTGSNGDPRRPGTLHYIHRDGQLNSYEKAITAVGGVLGRYDTDQRFPVVGFGAKYSGRINHCFQVGRTPEANGMNGVIDAYRGVFRTGLTMSGPTVFDEVINFAAAQARSEQDAKERLGQQTYTVLLILTDGAVTDINATKRAIEMASDAPLSIVIVGVGQADFSAMQFLDDFHGTSPTGSKRDIVQFVEFHRHAHNKISLTQATLDEIPDQVIDYFYGRGIPPLPPVGGSQLSIHPEEYNEDVDIDLSLDFAEDGEINLSDDTGAIYDDTKYGTYNNLQPMAPPAPTAPQAYAPQPPTTTAAPYAPPPQPYAPPPPQPYAPSAYVPPSTNQTVQAQPYNPTQPVQATIVQPQSVFYVQVPYGVSAGQQIQIQNPQTSQPMIIQVPPGIAPGGTFPVSY